MPNAKWKTLQDIPSFNPKDGAGSPWELALRLDVWKRQVLTLAATVQPLFADYVAECFKQAQERHDRRAAGESLTPLVDFQSVLDAPSLDGNWKSFVAF